MVGLLTLFVLGCACGLAMGLRWITLTTAIASVPLALLLFAPGLIPWNLAQWGLRRVLKKDIDPKLLKQMFRMDWRVLGTSFGISLIGWCGTNLMYYFSCLGFSPNVPVLYVFAVAPLIEMMRILPITASGLGSADMMIIFLFGLIGLPRTSGIMVAMVMNVVLILLPGLIGLVLAGIEHATGPVRVKVGA